MNETDRMDALGRKLVRADEFLWHLTNVSVGIAVFAATLLYAPSGSHALTVGVISVDPFYLLAPLSVAYICWTGIDFWSWYADADHQ